MTKDEMTTKSKHTPGPWRLDGDSIKGVMDMRTNGRLRTQSHEASSASFSDTVCKIHGWIELEAPMANARLIAAAPDLLEALRDCDASFVNWQLGQIPGRPEDILALVKKVRAAITKAKGRDT